MDLENFNAYDCKSTVKDLDHALDMVLDHEVHIEFKHTPRMALEHALHTNFEQVVDMDHVNVTWTNVKC